MNITPTTAGSGTASSNAGGGLGSLGQADFLRLMTVQMQQQDPFAPVDQKEMLAQMAQFSSLAGIADVNRNLQDIGARLDALIVAQQASVQDDAAAEPAAEPETPASDQPSIQE